MSARITIVYFSATDHVRQLAEAVAQGASDDGAEVRLRAVEDASHADLEWANGFAFGTPARYGLPAGELKTFIDTLVPLWKDGKLRNKVATSFVSSQNEHGGQESTVLALNNAFYHWGAIIVGPDSSEEESREVGANPYGTSYPSGGDDGEVPEPFLLAARRQGARVSAYAAKLAA